MQLDTAMYNHVKILQNEIMILKNKIDPNVGGQGYLYTTISTLEDRIQETINENLWSNFWRRYKIFHKR